MAGINNLLLNIFIILLSIFLGNVLLEKAGIRYKSFIVSFFSSSAIVFSMSFPFTIFPGQIYDLRIIPLIIGVLYGGPKAGLFITAITFLYRYYLGGSGFIYMSITFPPVLALTFFLIKRYKLYKRSRKLIIAIVLDFFMQIPNLILLYFRHLLSDEQILFLVAYTFFHSFGMMVSVYLIETLNENRKMRYEIQRTDKMQLIGELAASIAHEIRNPMTVSLGFAKLLKDEIVNEKHKKYIDMIISESDRAHTIINDYLTFAKPEIHSEERIDTSELILHVIGIISSYATLKNVQIQHKLEESLLMVGDSKKMIQILMNIIKNGIEAMPKGGQLRIFTNKKKDYVVIEIIDSGVGMTPEQINRLGTAFYSTKEVGTGLGMMVSYSLVQGMNGKIKVESQKGQGTRFSIFIPSTL